ncbi:MAG: copper resistance protein CopC/CopD [Acidimicrobiia bacterium]|nr:copper resistance protein CopC/CopD [Acidimicrobiia bacterium]
MLLAGALGLLAGPVGAHTGFESSDPSDGATIEEPIERLVLRFSGPAEPAGDGFRVLDPAGALRRPDSVTGDRQRQVWTLEFDPPLAGGAVGVRWTVQAPDAHPIDGSFSFIVAAPPPQPGQPDNATGAATELSEMATGGDGPGAVALETDTSDSAEATASAVGRRASPRIQELDAFLAESDARARYAEELGAAGRLLGLTAAMISIGGIVFAATVVANRRRDAYSVLRWVRNGGVLLIVAAVVELLAQLAVTSGDWSGLASPAALETAVLAPFGIALGLRALGGAILFTAAETRAELIRELARASARQRTAVPVGATHTSQAAPLRVPSWPAAPIKAEASPDRDRPATLRQLPASPGLALGALGLLLSFTFDGHTVSQGGRWVTAAVDIVHVAAGAVWAGGVFALAGVLWGRQRRGVRLQALELAVRFSVIAALALAAAGIAGTVLAVIILDSPAELWSTPWGRLLIVKFLAVACAAGLGAYNHFMVIPWMNDDPFDDSRSVWLRNMVTVEAFVLASVIAVTALLVGAAS